VINNPGAIDFGIVHAGAVAQQTLSVTNTASAPAAGLDATPGVVPAGLAASGTIIGLEPGATDSTKIRVGIDTTVAGPRAGLVPIEFDSDSGSGNTSPLPTQSIAVSGTVYRLAAPAIAPARGFYDECMKMDGIQFSLGFMKSAAAWPFGNACSFGSPGAGGSLGFSDPAAGIGYGYVTSQMGTALTGDPRDVALREALYSALEES